MQILFTVLHILYYGIDEENLMFEIQSSFTLAIIIFFICMMFISEHRQINYIKKNLDA